MTFFLNKKFFTWVLVLTAAVGFSGEEEAPLRDWSADIYGGFAVRSGNADEEAYRYGGEFEKKNGNDYRYRLKLDGRYRETNDNISESKTEASGEMRRTLADRWFAAGTLSVLHDDLKDISYRVKTGPGLGYYMMDTAALTADLSSGPLYVIEKADGGERSYLAWRVAQRFDWQVTDTFRCWFETEAVLNTSDTDAYTISFKSGVESKINSHLSLLVLIENDYDSLPDAGPDLKKNDFEISTGLRYTF